MKPKYRPVPMDPRARKYLDTLKESPRTQTSAEMAIKAFNSFRRWFKKDSTDSTPTPLRLGDLDNDILVDFNAWLRDLDYSAFSRDNYNALVRGFLAYAQEMEWTNPKFSLERAKYRLRLTKKKKKRSYPIPKVSRLFARALTYYDTLELPEADTPTNRRLRLDILRGRAVHALLYASAGRVSEVASLMRKQVQDGRRCEAEIVGKGEKERFLYFTDDALRALRVYLAERQDKFEPVFINHKREYGKPLSRQMAWHIVHSAAESVGAGKVSPHDFRHYRARQMLKEGAPLEAIQEILVV